MGAVLGALLSFVLPALIAGGASALNNVFNIKSTEETNQRNREYADAMTTAQWERDDTSFQRQVADAKAAGLSPLAVTGYAPSSTPVTSMAQAPQMDLSSLIGAITSAGSGMGDFFMKDKTLQSQENQFNKKIALETHLAEADLLKFEKELQQKQFEHKEQCEQFLDSLQYQYDVLNMEIEKANAEGNQQLEDANLNRIMDLSKSSMDFYSNYCSTLGITPKFQFYDDIDSYLSALNSFSMNWSSITLPDSTTTSSSESSMSSKNNGFGGASAFGFGVNLPTTGSSHSSGSATSDSEDRTRLNTIGALPDTAFPIFKPKKGKLEGKGDSIDTTSYKMRSRNR